MKRRTSDAPARVYSYGCLPPTEGAEQLAKQLLLAHRYRNKMVEIEHNRRAGIATAQREHDALGPLLEVIESTETQVAEARREMRLLRAGGRKQQDAAAEDRAGQRALIEAAQADLSVLRWLRGWARTHAREDEALKAAYHAVDEQAKKAQKSLRGSDEAPYWGTYLVVERAAEGWRKEPEAPRFARYAGEGRVAVQLQGGLSADELESGADTRLRLLPPAAMRAPEEPQSRRQIARAIAYGIVHFCRSGNMVRESVGGRGSGGPAPLRTVRIRIGSDGRAPIWATLPVLYDRPLPPDSRITWAWVIRRRDGVRYRYELQLVLEAESLAPKSPPAAGMVAVDIGARELPNGQVRTAYWVDSAGAQGELAAPLTRLSSPSSRGKKPDGSGESRRRDVVDDDVKVTDIKSIRDKMLDDVKLLLDGYRPQAPDWLRDRITHVRLWRSPSRVAVLRRIWERHDGDGEIYDALGAYLKQDRHLLDWETRERRRRAGRRREHYRVFATHLARTYAVIVVAKRDYRRQEAAPETAPASEGHRGRVVMRGASPGQLREEIRRAAKSTGAQVLEVEIAGDTAWCVDPNVSRRLLASGEVMSEQAAPLAGGATVSAEAPARKRRRLGTIERLDPLAGMDVSPGTEG